MSPCRTKSHEMIQTESSWPSTLTTPPPMLDKYGHKTAAALNRMLHAENIDEAVWFRVLGHDDSV